MFKRYVVLLILFITSISYGRAPLESYKNYIFLLVHGMGANPVVKGENYAFPEAHKKARDYVNNPYTRKSAIWDLTYDDQRSEDASWFGNISGSMFNRGFVGHTAWYDFKEPYQSPTLLSHYLGDRECDDNPMFDTTNKMGITPTSFHLLDLPFTPENEGAVVDKNIKKYYQNNTTGYIYEEKNVINIKTGEIQPGYTFHHYEEDTYLNYTENAKKYIDDDIEEWVNSKYKNKLDNFYVKYDKFYSKVGKEEGCYLDLAQEEFKSWYRISNRLKDTVSVPQDSIPKKFILIAHSMGGLTSREYITSNFYKGDVDKLVTLDTPHEGTAGGNYAQMWTETYEHQAVNFALPVASCIGLYFLYQNLSPSKIPGLDVSHAVGLPEWQKDLSTSQFLLSMGGLFLINQSITDMFMLGIFQNWLMVDVFSYTNGQDAIKAVSLGKYQRDGDGIENKTMSDYLFNLSKKEVGKGYSKPFATLVNTSGVVTPGGPGEHGFYLDPENNFMWNIPVLNIARTMQKWIIDGNWDGNNRDYVFRHALLSSAGSIANDWGSLMVPSWSGAANRVNLFNGTDVTRVDIDYNKYNGRATNDNDFVTAMYTLGNNLGLITFTIEQIMKYNGTYTKTWGGIFFASNIGVMAALSIGYDTPAKTPRGMEYLGWHGRMVHHVDNNSAYDAPSGVGSDKKILDQLIWEKPSLSIPVELSDVHDLSKGALLPFDANIPPYEISTNTIINFSDSVPEITAEMEDESLYELSRTLYIKGLSKDFSISSFDLIVGSDTYNMPANEVMSQATTAGFSLENGALKCTDPKIAMISLPLSDKLDSNSHNVEVKINTIVPDSVIGKFILSLGKKPAQPAANIDDFILAKNQDWENHITLKNRRPQIENGVENKKIAYMVNYWKVPKLRFNTIPRKMDFIIDDLQPDRMQELTFNFNYGKLQITYTPIVLDGETTRKPTSSEMDKPLKNMKLIVSRNYEEVASAVVPNPVNAWGNMVLDFDLISEQTDYEISKTAAFLEGENHLRTVINNRWKMGRVQNISMFIPGVAPTYTAIFPAFGHKINSPSPLMFRTNLVYLDSENDPLTLDDIEIMYTRVSDSSMHKIDKSNLILTPAGDSKRIFDIRTKDSVLINWGGGNEGEVVIKVNIRDLEQKFSIYYDSIKPIIEPDKDNNIYRPNLYSFFVGDRHIIDGDTTFTGLKDVFVTICDLEIEKEYFVKTYYDIGAGKKNLVDVFDTLNLKDGKYILQVIANDGTVKNENWLEDTKRVSQLHDNYYLYRPFQPSWFDALNYSYNNFNWSRVYDTVIIDNTAPNLVELTLSDSLYTSTISQNGYALTGYVLCNDGIFPTFPVDENDSATGNGVTAKLYFYPIDSAGNRRNMLLQKPLTPINKQNDTSYKYSGELLSVGEDTYASLFDGFESPQSIPDGIYNVLVVVKDSAANSNRSGVRRNIKGETVDSVENSSFVKRLKIDLTAPVVSNLVVPYFGDTSFNHTITVTVHEGKDNEVLRDLDKIKITASVTMPNGSVVLYEVDSSKYGKVLGYDTKTFSLSTVKLPNGGAGLYNVTITVADGYGDKANVNTIYSSFVIDHLPPKITSIGGEIDSPDEFNINALKKADKDSIFGIFEIKGNADDPGIANGSPFIYYELLWSKDTSGTGEILNWRKDGISIPVSYASKNLAENNVSIKPIGYRSTNSTLGYIDVSKLNDAYFNDKSMSFILKVITYDGKVSQEYVQGFGISLTDDEEQPKITINKNDTGTTLNFTKGDDRTPYKFQWNVDAKESPFYNTRYEVAKITGKGGAKEFTVYSRTTQGVNLKNLKADPSIVSSDKGVHIWVEEDDDSLEQKYYCKLSAGSEKTHFTFMVSSYDGKFIFYDESGSAKPINSIDGIDTLTLNLGNTIQHSFVIKDSLEAGKNKVFCFSSSSESGAMINTSSSFLEYKKGGVQETLNITNGDLSYETSMIPLIYSGKGEFLFIGDNIPVTQQQVTLPKVTNAESFLWDGKREDGSDAPSGWYRIYVTLENTKTGIVSRDEIEMEIKTPPITISNVDVTPDYFPLFFDKDSNLVSDSITLNFNTSKTGFITVEVLEGAKKIDTLRTMLDGSSRLMKKLLLPGRGEKWNVSWDGIWGVNAISPEGEYSFLIKAYENGDDTAPVDSAIISFTADRLNLYETKSNDTIFVDGTSDSNMKFGDYKIVNGLSDIIVSASVSGKMVTDVLIDSLVMKYKGTQDVIDFPKERYTLGVQVHKKSLDVKIVTFLQVEIKNKDDGLEWKRYNHINVKDTILYENDSSTISYSEMFSENKIKGSDGWVRFGEGDAAGCLDPIINIYIIPKQAFIKGFVDDSIKVYNDYFYGITKWSMNSPGVDDVKNILKTYSMANFIFDYRIDGLGNIEGRKFLNGNYMFPTDQYPERTNKYGSQIWNLECDSNGNGFADTLDYTLDENGNVDKSKKYNLNMSMQFETSITGHLEGYSGHYGGNDFRHQYWIELKITPPASMWDSYYDGKTVDQSHYGLNNVVNRYLTLDPTNIFLTGLEEVSPFGEDINFNIASRDGEKIKLHDLLDYIEFYDSESRIYPDVEIYLHSINLYPNNGVYQEKNQFIDVTAVIPEDDRDNVIPNILKNQDTTSRGGIFNLGALSSNWVLDGETLELINWQNISSLDLKISMGNKGNYTLSTTKNTIPLPWPMTESSFEEWKSSDGKNSNVDAEASKIHIIADSLVDTNGYFLHKIVPQITEMFEDSTEGIDLSEYFDTEKHFYTYRGGEIPEDNSILISLGHLDSTTIPDGFSMNYGNHHLNRELLEYSLFNDKLFSMDDDNDGEISEDVNDGIDNDNDLVINEDDSATFTSQVSYDHFWNGSGGQHGETYDLNKLLGDSAISKNIISDSNSILVKNSIGKWGTNDRISYDWKDAELRYKDGTPTGDYNIETITGDNKKNLNVKSRGFSGEMRRLAEIYGAIENGEDYEIYVSSDKGWEKLKNIRENPNFTKNSVGRLGMWDIKSSGDHKVMLVRKIGDNRIYKIEKVAIGKSIVDGSVTDEFGIAQLHCDSLPENTFMDIVALAPNEIPFHTEFDGVVGRVFSIHPALKTDYKYSLSVKLSRAEVENMNRTSTMIYTYCEGYGLQPMNSISWGYYSNSGDTATASDMDFAIVKGEIYPPKHEPAPQEAVVYALSKSIVLPQTLKNFNIKLSGDYKEVTVNNVYKTSIDMKVGESTSKNISVGVSNYFDVDNDGEVDISAKLEGIYDGVVYLRLNAIGEGARLPHVDGFFLAKNSYRTPASIIIDNMPKSTLGSSVVLRGSFDPSFTGELKLYQSSSNNIEDATILSQNITKDGSRFSVEVQLTEGVNTFFVSYPEGVLGLYDFVTINRESDSLLISDFRVDPYGSINIRETPIVLGTSINGTVEIFEIIKGMIGTKEIVTVEKDVENSELISNTKSSELYRQFDAVLENSELNGRVTKTITVPIDAKRPNLTAISSSDMIDSYNITDNRGIRWSWIKVYDKNGSELISKVLDLKTFISQDAEVEVNYKELPKVIFTMKSSNKTESCEITLPENIIEGSSYKYVIAGTDEAGNRSNEIEHTLDAYSYSKEIILKTDNESINLTNKMERFPLLVRLHKSNFDFSKATIDGHDIRFIDRNNQSLSYEVERWDPIDQVAEFWVLLNRLNPDRTEEIITLKYGNLNAPYVYSATNVWDEAFKAVYHFSESYMGRYYEPDIYSDFALYATESIILKDRSVLIGKVGAKNIELGMDSDVNGNVSVSENLNLKDRSVVTGDALVGGIVNNINNSDSGKVEGSILSVGYVTDSIDTKSVSVGTQSINVNGSSYMLQPNSYYNLNINNQGVVILTSGEYNFNEVSLGNDVEIICDVSYGPVWLNINSNFSMSDRSKITTKGSQDGSMVRIYTSQLQSLNINNDVLVNAIITAPKGSVTLGDRVIVRGAIYAKNILVGIEDTIFHNEQKERYATGNVQFEAPSTDKEKYVLWAEQSIQTGDDCEFVGDIGSRNSVSIGHQNILSSNIYSQKNVSPGDRTNISGNVYFGENFNQGNQVEVSGVTSKYIGDIAIEFAGVDYLAGVDNIEVGNDGTKIISAGSYGSVMIRDRGQLALLPGEYHFNSLNINNDASLKITEPTQTIIIISNDLIVGDRVKIICDDNSNATKIFTDGAYVTIGRDNIINAKIEAKSSTIFIKDRTKIIGSVIGKSINISHQVELINPVKIDTTNSDTNTTVQIPRNITTPIKVTDSMIVDATENRNHGVEQKTDNFDGIIAGSEKLSDSSNIITNSLKLNKKITFSGWIRVPEIKRMPIIGYYTDNKDWYVGFDGDNNIEFTLGSQTVETPFLHNNQWVYIVAVYTGSQMGIYVDGVQKGIKLNEVSLSLDQQVLVIGDWLNRLKIIGDIDEFRISDYARNGEWILLSYLTQKLHSPIIKINPVVKNLTLKYINNEGVLIMPVVDENFGGTIEIQKYINDGWYKIVDCSVDEIPYLDSDVEDGNIYSYRVKLIENSDSSSWVIKDIVLPSLDTINSIETPLISDEDLINASWKLVVSPNPVDDMINVSFNNPFDDLVGISMVVRVYDVSGNLQLEFLKTLNLGNNSFSKNALELSGTSFVMKISVTNVLIKELDFTKTN